MFETEEQNEIEPQVGAEVEGVAEAEMEDQAFEVEAFESGGLHSPLFSGKSEKIASGDFDPQFTLDLLEKDLSLALEAGGDAPLPLPVAGAAREAVEAARGLGHGESDMAAVIRYLEAVGGLEVRR